VEERETRGPKDVGEAGVWRRARKVGVRGELKRTISPYLLAYVGIYGRVHGAREMPILPPSATQPDKMLF
jgi:hypothetical protein